MKYDENNIFAKILRGEIPCNKIYEDNFKNPYNSSATNPVDWSNGSCPGPSPSQGQMILGYAHKNNTCGMAGNVACVTVNIGDKDKNGSDNFLSKEFNLCEF